MPIKRILLVHGIGHQTPTFSDSWVEAIQAAVPRAKVGVEFKGLWWEDLRQKAAQRYPIISRNFASVLEGFGIKELKQILDSKTYQLVHSYVMDVLVYVGLPDMTLYFENECFKRLKALSQGREGEALIISHSLGSAMIPHVLWRIRQNTGSIPYHSLILLATPLGFASPIDWAIADFLEIMGRGSHTDRAATLRAFALAFSRNGDNRLHILSNRNDIVCSDARFPLLGDRRDVIPVRQGFDDDEVALLNAANPGCHRQLAFGEAEAGCVGGNHDVFTYFRQPEFKTALESLLDA
ncbi:MAG TPA: hypothetical protein VK465_09700 [Fibrobacteria bacterium]|nr:hypothetical protein [Fibrobacteria bacterium]